MTARREPEDVILGEQALGRREAAEPETFVWVVERELELAPSAHIAAALRLGREPQPHLPQQLATGEPEAVAAAYPHQMLDRGTVELGGSPPHEVADARELTAPLPLGHHRGRCLFTPVTDERETYTDGLTPFPPLPSGEGGRDEFPLSGTERGTGGEVHCAPHITLIHVRELDIDSVVQRIAPARRANRTPSRSEEHTSELQSPDHLVCRLLLE